MTEFPLANCEAPVKEAESRREAVQRFCGVLLGIAPWAVAALGVVLRVRQYLQDRSLFLDEAFVAKNIAQKSAGELLRPLFYDQRAPAGFLLAVKGAFVALGGSDLALRLAPLLAGCGAMVIFFAVARRFVGREAAVLAMAFFAFSEAQIFYSSDLKQYSCDTLAVLGLLWAFAALEDRPLNLARAAGLALLGSAAMWFSFPALFALGGLAACFGIREIAARRWSQIAWLMGTGMAWGINFAGLYWIQLRHFNPNSDIRGCWLIDFMPLLHRRPHAWLFDKIQELASLGVGLEYPGLALLAALLGVRAIWQQSRYRFWLLLAPLLAAIAVSALGIYPLGGRLALYLAPPTLLLIVAGIEFVFRAPCTHGRRVDTARWLAIGMAVMLLLQPLNVMCRGLRGKVLSNPMFPDYRLEEAKPVMKHIREHWQPGDLVYMFSQSDVAFRYYADRFGFRPEDTVKGIQAGMMAPQWSEVRKDLEKYRGRHRVWFFFTHVSKENGVDEQKLWLYFLDQMGRQLDQFVMPDNCNAAVYLYDLSEPPRSAADKT